MDMATDSIVEFFGALRFRDIMYLCAWLVVLWMIACSLGKDHWPGE